MHPFNKQERPATFRSFSRKGWSLFSALHREVRIGVLGVATLATATPCLMAATPVSAEGLKAPGEAEAVPAAADTLLLGEAAVSASRAPLAADVAARQVLTLTQRDLAAAGVRTVNDVLKLSAGVDVRQRGGFGIQTDISIDGGTHDQITILLNGVPLVNPQTGHNAADFPLNLSDIERIEILEGAASRVMGSQAFSGAINVVTKQAATAQSASSATASPLEWMAEGGSYATFRTEARTAWQWGRWSASASGSWQRSDGAVENGDFKGGKGYGQLSYASPELDLHIQMGATANDFGANTFYSAAYPNQWEATRRYLLSAQATTKGRVHFSPMLSWVRSSDHFQLIRHSSTGENFHRGDVFTAALNAWTEWALGRTAVGAELREESILSSNLGREMTPDRYVHVRGESGHFYTHSDDRTNVSYFLEHNILWRRFTLSAGIMAERNNAIDNRFRFYPGIDLSYRPSSFWRLYASCNRSLRLPSFTDLWYKSPTQEGNVGLRPEECTAVRLGADLLTSALTLRFKAHYQRGNHMIDWVMRSADDIYHATSFSLDNYGLGLDARLPFDRLLGKRQPLQELNLSYAWLHQHRRAGEPYFKSNYALEYLRHKFVARLSHRIVSDLSAQWTVRVQQREGNYLVYEAHQSTGRLHPYGTHAQLDCRLQWTRPHYELFADLTNLTAHRSFDIANVRQPGFLAMGGVRFRL